jgi:hypothetical protein
VKPRQPHLPRTLAGRDEAAMNQAAASPGTPQRGRGWGPHSSKGLSEEGPGSSEPGSTGPHSSDLEKRHAALTRRLAAKQGEKGRYVKLYAQGLVDDEELEVHLADLKYQVENLKMLIASVESDLARKDEDALVARNTEAWLLTLRENLEEVETDTEEAYLARRELARLLVERIYVDRGEDGRPRVEITYRFGPPLVEDLSADGVQNSERVRQSPRAWGLRGSAAGTPQDELLRSRRRARARSLRL